MTKIDIKVPLTSFEELYKADIAAFSKKVKELKNSITHDHVAIAFHSDEYEVKEGDRFDDAAQFKKWIRENFPLHEDDLVDF